MSNGVRVRLDFTVPNESDQGEVIRLVLNAFAEAALEPLVWHNMRTDATVTFNVKGEGE